MLAPRRGPRRHCVRQVSPVASVSVHMPGDMDDPRNDPRRVPRSPRRRRSYKVLGTRTSLAMPNHFPLRRARRGRGLPKPIKLFELRCGRPLGHVPFEASEQKLIQRSAEARGRWHWRRAFARRDAQPVRRGAEGDAGSGLSLIHALRARCCELRHDSALDRMGMRRMPTRGYSIHCAHSSWKTLNIPRGAFGSCHGGDPVSISRTTPPSDQMSCELGFGVHCRWPLRQRESRGPAIASQGQGSHESHLVDPVHGAVVTGTCASISVPSPTPPSASRRPAVRWQAAGGPRATSARRIERDRAPIGRTCGT